MTPKLSVLVTYHNEFDLLPRCIASLGSYDQRVEVLVHDDASQRRPILPVEVRWLHSETNVGPSVARNRLLAAAAGAYVHFHDADDAFHVDWLPRVLAEIDRDRFDLLISEVRAIDGNEPIERVLGLRAEHEHALLDFILEPGRALLLPASTWRRDWLSAHGGFDPTFDQSEDFELALRAVLPGPQVRLLLDELVVVHWHGSNRSRRAQARVYSDAIRALLVHERALGARAADSAAQKAGFVALLAQRHGAFAAAWHGYALARRLGVCRYEFVGAGWRRIAGLVGPWMAEAIGALIRRARGQTLRA